MAHGQIGTRFRHHLGRRLHGHVVDGGLYSRCEVSTRLQRKCHIGAGVLVMGGNKSGHGTALQSVSIGRSFLKLCMSRQHSSRTHCFAGHLVERSRRLVDLGAAFRFPHGAPPGLPESAQVSKYMGVCVYYCNFYFFCF